MKLSDTFQVAVAAGVLLGLLEAVVSIAFIALRARARPMYAAAVAALVLAASALLLASVDEGPICHEHGCFAATSYVNKMYLFIAIVIAQACLLACTPWRARASGDRVPSSIGA